MRIRINKKMFAMAAINAFVLIMDPVASEAAIKNETTTETTRSIDDTVSVDAVIANTNVNIRKEADIESEIVGRLTENDTLRYISHTDDGWYQVMYDDSRVYVSDQYTSLIQEKDFPYGFLKTVYLTADSNLYFNKYLDQDSVKLDKYELLEVYEEYDNSYLVKVSDYIGYVSKENTVEIDNTFVVVDISDQEAKLYDCGEVTMTTPVVTGKPDTNKEKNCSTPVGIYQIYDITKNRDLVNKNIRCYVNYMMKFNGNIGLHDAEYHIDDNGKKHGWRNKIEFGSDTYLNNGSHGCVNMTNDAAKYVYEHVEEGTKVLVKE